MFFSSGDISETEKINRIYNMLRAERRGRIFRFIFKLFLLGGVLYGYYYFSLPIHENERKEIINTIQAKITEFTLPMVGGMVQTLTQNIGMTNTITSPANKTNISPHSTNLPPGITPEMIKAVQDAMKK